MCGCGGAWGSAAPTCKAGKSCSMEMLLALQGHAVKCKDRGSSFPPAGSKEEADKTAWRNPSISQLCSTG